MHTAQSGFCISHREYIVFQNPDQIRMFLSGFYIRIGPDSVPVGAEISVRQESDCHKN